MFKFRVIQGPDAPKASAARCGGAAPAALLIAVALAVLPACDSFLDISSPALAEDMDLENPTAMISLLRGTQGDFVHAAAGEAGQGGLYLAGALLTDELVHSGVWRGHRSFSDGFSRDDTRQVAEMWAAASQARWTAENLVPRMQRVMQTATGEDELEETLGNQLAAAMLWAGFANRLMGDNFCQAVIDGGGLQDNRIFYERAETHFTAAIAQATAMGRDTLRQAAQAGRAQTRMMMGDWAGAVADANDVETLLEFYQTHGGWTGREREWNWILRSVLFANAEVTVWGTPFEMWGRVVGTTAGDPRAQYDKPGSVTEGRDGRRPFFRQRKHTATAGNIAVVRGTEMRLIEAEALLVQGNWPDAVAKINEVRAFRRSAAGGLVAADRTLARMPNVSATTAEQAWELLMRERGIELWLEGRRLPDMRRWSQSPGAVPFEVVRQAGSGDETTDARRNVLDVQDALCIPVSSQEKRTNPNTNG
ncbi:MAG: RagB/SusD family nutrient uptake outer membrane protein [Gemmatimonadetes bacterium]|nr:RagB/SusD family nutrient uptake outer membrane protein [Gemmatimonadota bacterium]